jgi:DNA-binding transcriptional MerR regulator
MFKISDFSQLARISVRTLRLYDELDLLKPAQVDRMTGYRHYDASQLPRLNRILALKDLGFSLEQIAQLLQNNIPAERLRGMMLMKRADVERELEENQARLERVEARLRQIENEGKLSPYDVTLKEAPSLMIAAAKGIVPTLGEVIGARQGMFKSIYNWLEQNRIEPGKPELVLYPDQEYVEQNIQLETAVPLGVLTHGALPFPPDGNVFIHELPAIQKMASVIHYGRFGDVNDAITALCQWVGENGYLPGGPFREIHLFGRENDLDDFDSVTIEMQLPVEKQ